MKNKMLKIVSVIVRGGIKLLSYLNTGLYMKMYALYLKRSGVLINGTPKYIDPSVWFDGKDYSYIVLENNITISKNVQLLTHDYSITTMSAALGKVIARGDGERYTLKPIHIGNNVFVGLGCIILPGTTIGDNTIIGAGSVVRGEIPGDSIVIGNPAVVVNNSKKWAKRILEQNLYLEE